MRKLNPSSNIHPSQRSGRWVVSENSTGSMVASWTGASLSFLFSGSKLYFCTGPETERKEKDNGGTPMLAIITGPSEELALKNISSWRTLDPTSNSEIIIFDEKEGSRPHKKTFVRLVLIDWASTFELSALMADDEGVIQSPELASKRCTNVLIIGDSISAAMAVSVAQGGELIPHGVLDAFPFVAQRLLLDQEPSRKIELELVSFPGLNLVRPTDEERIKGYSSGMIDAFFWESIWTKESFVPTLNHTVIIVELGTNDQAFEIPKDRFGQTMIAFIEKLKKASNSPIQHIWLVPPFPDVDTNNLEINGAMESFIPLLEAQFGDETKFKVCDLVEGLSTEDTVDGVHPRLSAHHLIGKRLAEFILKELFDSNLN